MGMSPRNERRQQLREAWFMRGSLMVVCALLGVPWPGATAHGQAETVLRVSERLGAVPKWIDPDRTEIVAAPNGGYSVFDATRHSIVLFESDGHLARRFPVVAGIGRASGRGRVERPRRRGPAGGTS